jgi:hypothetical protein
VVRVERLLSVKVRAAGVCAVRQFLVSTPAQRAALPAYLVHHFSASGGFKAVVSSRRTLHLRFEISSSFVFSDELKKKKNLPFFQG